MKLTVCSVLLATLLVASTSVESSLDVSPSNHARRHHTKVQNLQKRDKFQGQATWYGWNQGDQGACGEYLPQNGFYVALNHGQYGNMNQQSSYCGKTITITNGLKTTQARILDACPGDGSTCKWGALDMSKPLFEFFNPLGVGVFPMTWWVGGDSSDSGSSSGGSSSSNSNNDDDSSDSDSGSNGAAAAKQAAQEKAAQEKAAQQKADAKKAAAEKAAKEKAAAEKAAAEKKAAAKKAAAKKAAKEKAAKAASEKAQHQNIAAFGEIMQTLNQIVENAVVSPSSGAASASVSSASASSSSSSSKD